MSPRARLRRSALRALGVGLGALLALLLALRGPSMEGSLRFALGGRSFELLAPGALWALLLVPVLIAISRGSPSELSRGRRLGSLWLRALSVAVLTLALARPRERVATQRTSTVLLVDVSDSVAPAALAQARAYVARAWALRGEHALEVVSFAREGQRLTASNAREPPAVLRHADGRASNHERALALAAGLLQPDAIPQIALFSDGRETEGRLLRAADQLAARGIPLFVPPEQAEVLPEVAIEELAAPARVPVRAPFALTARVVATRETRLRVRLLRDGAPAAGEPERSVSLPPGPSTLTFPALLRAPGRARYRLELLPEAADDQLPDNNHAERTIDAQGAPRVLYVEREPDHAYALRGLLEAAGFEVDVRSPASAPRSAAELAEVDFYVLSDVARSALPAGSLEAIERYMLDGGGFLMAGGEQSFAAGGYQGSAFERQLPVVLESPLAREEPTLALLLAIDKSGSMAGEKLERAKEAALATAELLAEGDYLGVIGFDAEPLHVARLSVVRRGALLARELGALTAGGGTALFPALDAAYRDLVGVRARIKHVVLLTDGQTDEAALAPLVRSMRADAITLSTVGLGEDVNRGLLSELAQLGAGRAYFTRDPSQVPRLFTQEAELVAHTSIVERPVHARLMASADFLRGVSIDSAPALRGYQTSRARPLPAELLLATERGDPLLARMRVGLGWSLAFTSDLKSRWSAEWFRWRPLSQLLAQLVRTHMRREREDELRLESRLEGDTLVCWLDALDRSERFLNDLEGALHVRRPPEPARSIPLRALAPGRYEARLPGASPGEYDLEARLGAPDGTTLRASSRVAVTAWAEHRPPFAVNGELLRAAAHLTGGGRLPDPARLFEVRGRTRPTYVERWQPLVWLVLVLFVLDVALRRARLPSTGARVGA